MLFNWWYGENEDSFALFETESNRYRLSGDGMRHGVGNCYYVAIRKNIKITIEVGTRLKWC